MGSAEHLTGLLGFKREPQDSTPTAGQGSTSVLVVGSPTLRSRLILPPPGELIRFLVKMFATAWLAFVAGLAFWSVLPAAVGWHPELVLTGSMEPNISPGDVVLVANVDGPVPPGRIVLVEDPNRSTGTYLHRVVRYDDDGRAVTKGDANATEDVEPVEQSRVLAQARLLVPAIGLPAIWLREGRFVPFGLSALVTWGCAVVCLSGALPDRRRRAD